MSLIAEQVQFTTAETAIVFAEKETENIDDVLDQINDYRNDLKGLFLNYDKLITVLEDCLPKMKDNKTELVSAQILLGFLHDISTKLYNAFKNSSPKIRNGLKTSLENFEMYLSDFKAFFEDMKKMTKPNTEIENLLKLHSKIGG